VKIINGPYLNQSVTVDPTTNEIINDHKRTKLKRRIAFDDDLRSWKGNLSTEQMTFSFKLRDKTLFNETTETCEIFYKLVGFSLIENLFPIELFERNLTISNVMETKQQDSWCSNADDEKLYFTNSSEFMIFTSNSNQYHVYVLENERFYSSGYFILTVLYTPKYHYYAKDLYYDNRFERKRNVPDFAQYNLTDVTSFMLQGGNDSNVETTFFMVRLIN
jgi:hypothetical protein